MSTTHTTLRQLAVDVVKFKLVYDPLEWRIDDLCMAMKEFEKSLRENGGKDEIRFPGLEFTV